MGSLLISDYQFWEEKAFLDFNYPKEKFFALEGNHPVDPSLRYLEVLTSLGKVESGSEQFISLDECLLRATRQGHQDKMLYFILEGASNLNLCLYEAVTSGNLDTVKFLCRNGADDISGAITIAIEKLSDKTITETKILNYLIGRRDLNNSEESLKLFVIDDNSDNFNDTNDLSDHQKLSLIEINQITA